ncbi:MAG: hypothetical protein WAK60_11095 [Sedimentisphaerales bacterium]
MSVNNVKRRKYKKDFLKEVIVRIDFDTPLPIAVDGPAKDIYATDLTPKNCATCN